MNEPKLKHDVHANQSTKSKFLNWSIFGALGIIAIGIGLFLFWSLSTNDILVIKNQPFPIRTVQDSNGNGLVVLTADYCKNVKADGRLRMSFVSKNKETFLPVAEERGPVGCQKTDLPVLIPAELTPDTYHIHFRVTYQPNPLKTIVEEFDTKEFTLK